MFMRKLTVGLSAVAATVAVNVSIGVAAATPASSVSPPPPRAAFRAPGTIVAGQPVVLSAAASTPAGALSYRWDLDGTGAFATDRGREVALAYSFPTNGAFRVSLRVADNVGRIATTSRVIHVQPPPVFGFSVTPPHPKAGQTVTFHVRRLTGQAVASSVGAHAVSAVRVAAAVPLAPHTLATMTFGDNKPVTGQSGGLTFVGRGLSNAGNFTHLYSTPGRYHVFVEVSDQSGYVRGLIADLTVTNSNGPTSASGASGIPAIEYTPTVRQGDWGSFIDSSPLIDTFVHCCTTKDQSGVTSLAHHGALINSPFGFVPFGGDPQVFGTRDQVNTQLAIEQQATSTVGLAGQTFGGAPRAGAARDVRARASRSPRPHAHRATLFSNTIAPTGIVNEANNSAPLPTVDDCPGGLKFVNDTTVNLTPPTGSSNTATLEDIKQVSFSVHTINYGDGAPDSKVGPVNLFTPSDPRDYFAQPPTLVGYHQYQSAGDFTATLSDRHPTNLSDQLGQWEAACKTHPLNATATSPPDARFTTDSVSVPVHVIAVNKVLSVNGLQMVTSSELGFTETDTPGIFQTAPGDSIFINTARHDPFDSNNKYHAERDPTQAAGVLELQPSSATQGFLVDPGRGEIIGDGTVFYHATPTKAFKLGAMPDGIGAGRGLIIPAADSNGGYAFNAFTDPPDSLVDGPPRPPGAAFHVNSAQVTLAPTENGDMQASVNMPQLVGPGGNPGPQTLDFRTGAGAASVSRGALAHAASLVPDNFNLNLPTPLVIVPDLLELDNVKLAHQSSPPAGQFAWQASGDLKVLGQTLSVDNSNNPCADQGLTLGLGFNDDGSLGNAGAALLRSFPIPGASFLQLSNPAIDVTPASATRPFTLLGCASLTDSTGNLFAVKGCFGLLLQTNAGQTDPVNFCPDESGSTSFTPVSDTTVRVSGSVFLAPQTFNVALAHAFLEYDSHPFQIVAKGHFGYDFLGGLISVNADVIGHFTSPTDFFIGGHMDMGQNLVCVPVLGCPSVGGDLAIGSNGLGACGEIFGVGIGGFVNFNPLSVNVLFPGCDLGSLRQAIGGGASADLPTSRRAHAAAVGAALPLNATDPFALEFVEGAGGVPPRVQVTDPTGKVVLQDNGADVQGLTVGRTGPQVPAAGATTQDGGSQPAQTPETGIVHNDAPLSYHDANIDMRHATIVEIAKPMSGSYKITALPGSSAITRVTFSEGKPVPNLNATVGGNGTNRSLQIGGTVAAGDRVTVSETSNRLAQPIPGAAIASASADGPTAGIARVSRILRFHPAPGPGGRRRIVATVFRRGIPLERVTLTTYMAPNPPEIGRIRHVQLGVHHNTLRLSWSPAVNAIEYRLVVRLHHEVRRLLVLGRTHSIAITDPGLALGARIVLTPLGRPGLRQGPTASTVLRPRRRHRTRLVL